MTKRTFFKRAMAMVACVALAPEIAFGVRLKMAEAPVIPTHGWMVMRWGNRDSYHVCIENKDRLPWDEFEAKLKRQQHVTERLNEAGGAPVECSINLYR